MFSGLTNQVSSWMGAAKGEPQDEEVPTPTKDATGETTAEGDKQSPTKGGSKLDLITNVKSQMTGWLGSGIPIPGLRKNEAAPSDVPEAAPVETAEVAESKTEAKEDDDNSSATGGADSRPGSTGGTPTEEQPAGVGNGSSQSKKIFSVDAIEVPDMQELTTKAVAGAKSLGNFLYSAVNKAGAKVSEASAKIKKTVEENSILGEFNREQDAFIKGQEKGGGATAAPWVGAPNEASLKEECLSLSTDRRNFVRAPPAGVEFDFDYDKMYPVAVAIMAEDPNLEKMRFDLVPKVITEENFWRNYFYRVSLICQANEADAVERQASADDSQDSKTASEGLIASEKSSQASIDDVKMRIKSLKVDRDNDDEQWEKELEAELKEYEVVADKTSDEKWEKECEDLLGEEVDLK
ncbi:synapse-associated protein of 47 kDa isoform X2 [Zerene cesonia]|uniref:synapse-associated protein of 47 kDa isoform X2 n=1 Tax=Zerene cesonia TaxID=33412 RepID=UPI0018E55121|nr:synapse-associated protein of 47 kDa isoform X2 [Zerene cesonia]